MKCFVSSIFFMLFVSYVHSQPPINDMCINATFVDPSSNVTIRGNTRKATKDPQYYYNGVWYQGFSTSDELIFVTVCSKDVTTPIYSIVYTGESCDYLNSVTKKIYYDQSSTRGCTGFKFLNQANKTYRLFLALDSIVGDKFTMTLRSVGTFLPNDECTEAILIDPNTYQEIVGSTIASTTTYAYYKVDGGYNDIAVNATLCVNKNQFHVLKVVTYSTNDCSGYSTFFAGNGTYSSECVTVNFIPTQNKTYFIAVHVGDIGDAYTLTIGSYHNFFELISSSYDSDYGVVLPSSISYYQDIYSPRLNIRASFAPDIPVTSAFMTFDNPARSYCENVAPYSVFGDVGTYYQNGIRNNYNNATIPLGTHVVTATPYAQRSCQGPAGPQLSQTFEVSGCMIEYNNNGYPIPRGPTEIKLYPCSRYIEATISCRFYPTLVKLSLINVNTNQTIRSISSRYRPYRLPDVIFKKLDVGNYTIAATIDGIYHPSQVTFIHNETCF